MNTNSSGSTPATTAAHLIAIPVTVDRLADHFGAADSFVLVETDRERRVILRSRILPSPPHTPGTFPRWLREQGVQTLVVASRGIAARALDYLLWHGVAVYAGMPGTPAETLALACLEHRLPPVRRGCARQSGQPETRPGVRAAAGCRLKLK